MARPLLTEAQTAQALAQYRTNRASALRSALLALDATVTDAFRLSYEEVLTRVHALVTDEIEAYAEPAPAAPASVPPPGSSPGQAVAASPDQEEASHG